MTENEAIKNVTTYVYMECENMPQQVIKALNVMKDATKEIQQYRAYKEIFEIHFSKEALELLSDKEEFGKWLERGNWIAKRCDEINRELEQYREIGTIEEFKALKEKNEPKKAKWEFDDFTAKFGNPYRCSNCDEEFGDTYNYCPNCGSDMYAD